MDSPASACCSGVRRDWYGGMNGILCGVTRTPDQACRGGSDQRVSNNGVRPSSAGGRTDLTSSSKGRSMAEDDPFELSRFVAAQDLVFETVLAELRAGRKETHWIWFIFPQLRALGRSPTANFYGIGSIEEARACLRHPVLADRLARSVNAVLGVSDRSAHEIFGSPEIPLVDDAVQRSCRGGRGTIPARSGAFLCRRTRSSYPSNS